MKIEHYEKVITGGNCTALSRLIGTKKEILLTDEDGSRAPSGYPLWAGVYYRGEYRAGEVINSLFDLREFEAFAKSIA